jgi:hypothetical protein
MGDYDNDILSDPSGLAGLSSTAGTLAPTSVATPAATPAAETGEPITTPTETPAVIDESEDINLEMSDD